MFIHTRLLPLFKCFVGKANVALPAIPICIVIEDGVHLSPVSGEQNALVPEHDIALEGETGVVFHASALDLVVATKGDDVVAKDVFLAVMLVEAAVRGAVDEIVFCQDMRRSLVEIDPPTAVA